LTHELYDVVSDPSETRNRYAEETLIAEEMSVALSAFISERGRFLAGQTIAAEILKEQRALSLDESDN
jgi:hypothetical protein